MYCREWPVFHTERYIVGVDECDGLFVFAVLDRERRAFLSPRCAQFKQAVDLVRREMARMGGAR